MKNNRRLGLFYFILNSASLTRDVTCSRLYLDGKNMGRKCQMNNLFTCKKSILQSILLRTTKFTQTSNSEIRFFEGLFLPLKPEPEKIFKSFLLLTVGNLSDIQTANISSLKIFLYGMKNAGPRHGTPEMKIQKMSFP